MYGEHINGVKLCCSCQVWFQNRRSRQRRQEKRHREKMAKEEAERNLKHQHSNEPLDDEIDTKRMRMSCDVTQPQQRQPLPPIATIATTARQGDL